MFYAAVMVPVGTIADYEAHKGRLLGSLTGTVLEIGAGRGRNFVWFGDGVHWIGLEPDAKRRQRLRQMARDHGHHEPILEQGAEQIPLPDSSVDAVVGIAVLCSVADPARVLREVKRVLRPGGVYVFFEHVVAPRGSLLWLAQLAWAPLSRRLSGCDPTRETWRHLDDAGFDEIDTRWFRPTLRWDIEARYVGGQARLRS